MSDVVDEVARSWRRVASTHDFRVRDPEQLTDPRPLFPSTNRRHGAALGVTGRVPLIALVCRSCCSRVLFPSVWQMAPRHSPRGAGSHAHKSTGRPCTEAFRHVRASRAQRWAGQTVALPRRQDSAKLCSARRVLLLLGCLTSCVVMGTSVVSWQTHDICVIRLKTLRQRHDAVHVFNPCHLRSTLPPTFRRSTYCQRMCAVCDVDGRVFLILWSLHRLPRP